MLNSRSFSRIHAASIDAGVQAFCALLHRATMKAHPEKGDKLMVTLALYVQLEAKPGKESEVADFLNSGLAIVQDEPATTAWFALQLGPSTFGIFDAFPDEEGRQAHLSGRVAEALMANAAELLAEPPSIQKVDVLAAKLP
jgi:quinol monooxygenase YgiN